MKKGWFGPKKFGFGVSPRRWQGWVATGVFGLALILWTRLFQGLHAWLWAGWGISAVLFSGLVALTYQGKGCDK